MNLKKIDKQIEEYIKKTNVWWDVFGMTETKTTRMLILRQLLIISELLKDLKEKK